MFWNQQRDPIRVHIPPHILGWTSVKDELPEDGQAVWVLNLDNVTKYGFGGSYNKVEYKLRIYGAEFHRSKGWNIQGCAETKVHYWTALDYSGVKCSVNS